MLACQDCQIGLSKLKGTVLKHTNLMKSLTTLVSEGISIPDSILHNAENFENTLKTTLKNVNGALISLILLLNLFCLLLSPINFIHNVLKLLTS